MEPPPPEDHSFIPANHKLVSVYLRRRVAGEPLPPATAAHFHNLDIYAAEPATLTAGLQPLPATGKGEGSSWLFFTPVRCKSSTDSRKSRKVGGGLGTWHSEHAAEAVLDDQGNHVGNRQLFSYKAKGGKRSGWSMWEFTAAEHEGGESLLVLCKIHHQAAHATSRRGADGSAARSARKRKGTDDGVDQARSAPVKRRLFAPPAPTPPAASQDEITVVSEAISYSRTETEAPNDTPMSVLSRRDEQIISQDKIGAASEVIPASRSEVEALKDTPRSMLSFSDQPAMSQGITSASLRSSVLSFAANSDAAQRTIIGTAMDLFIAELEAWHGTGMATFDCGFPMDSSAPPAPEHCYRHESFTDRNGGDMSGLPLRAPVADSWTGYDTTAFCSAGNPFLVVLPLYNECGAGGASGCWTGWSTTAFSSGGNAIFGSVPTFHEWSISGSAGAHYGSSVSSAPFLPSAVPSQWCSGQMF